MKITDKELEDLVGDILAGLESILRSHQAMNESMLDQNIDSAKEQVRKKREEVRAISDRIRDMKDRLKRQKETQRKANSKKPNDKQTTNEGSSSVIQIRNQKGQLLGFLQPSGKNQINILSRTGKLLGREVNGITLDQKGNVVSWQKAGLLLIGRNTKE